MPNVCRSRVRIRITMYRFLLQGCMQTWRVDLGFRYYLIDLILQGKETQDQILANLPTHRMREIQFRCLCVELVQHLQNLCRTCCRTCCILRRTCDLLDNINITETNLSEMNKFYNSLIKYDKFYNKFYTSSTSSTQNPMKMKRKNDGRRSACF